MKEITVSQFISAVKLGGYPQGFGHLIYSSSPDRIEEGEIIDACAMGQAALNLGINDTSLDYKLTEVFLSRVFKCDYCNNPLTKILWDVVVHLNDTHRLDLETIAQILESKLSKSVKAQKMKVTEGDWENTNYQGIKI